MRKLRCAARIGLIVCLNTIGDARAQSNGNIKVNEDGVAFASQLIRKDISFLMEKARGMSTSLRRVWKMSSSAFMDLPNTRSGISAWTNVTQ